MSTTNLVLQLQHAESKLTFCPHIGAAIARFTWRGHDILRHSPDTAIKQSLVRQMGVYPLVPYSNRIGNAKLIVGEQTFTLRPNFLPEPHAIHGLGWQREWQLVKHTEDFAELTLQHTPDADWPFAFDARQTMHLAANALKLTLELKNADQRLMPAGLGFHPFFPLVPGTHMQSEWRGMWKMGTDSLPTVLGPVPPDADFSQLRPVTDWKVDNCFIGWNRRVAIDYPTHRVEIDASDACRQIVVFAPNDGRNFIALEPVTNINNAFALAAKGVADTGTRLLASGESLNIAMSITPAGRAAANATSA